MVDRLVAIGQSGGLIGLACIAVTFLGVAWTLHTAVRDRSAERIIIRVKGLITLEIHRKVNKKKKISR